MGTRSYRGAPGGVQAAGRAGPGQGGNKVAHRPSGGDQPARQSGGGGGAAHGNPGKFWLITTDKSLKYLFLLIQYILLD